MKQLFHRDYFFPEEINKKDFLDNLQKNIFNHNYSQEMLERFDGRRPIDRKHNYTKDDIEKLIENINKILAKFLRLKPTKIFVNIIIQVIILLSL